MTKNHNSTSSSIGLEMIAPLTEAARDALVMMDGQGRVTFWNPAAEDLFGYSAAEMLGQPAHRRLAPAEMEERYTRALARFRQKGRGRVLNQTLEMEALRKDGSLLPVELSLSAARVGNERQAVAVIRDISERKRAEQELKDSASLLRATIEAVDEALLVTDNSGRVVLFNSPFLRLWGFEEAGIGPEDYRPGLKHILSRLKKPESYIARARAMATETQAQSFDVFETLDGRTLELRSRPQYREEEIIGRVWSFTDITQRRQAEEEIRRHRDHLSQLVSERTLKLSQANRDLEKEIQDRILVEEENLKFAAMAENSGVLICLTDFEGRLIYLNQAGREMVGLAENEPDEDEPDGILEFTLADFFAQEADKQRVGKIVHRVGQDSKWSGQLTLNHLTTGREIQAQADFFLVRHPGTGRRLCLGAVARDIGDLITARGEARFSERTVRSMMNALSEAAFVLGPWGEILEANQATADLLNRPAAELKGADLLSLLPGDLSAIMQRHMIEVLRSGRMVTFDAEHRSRVTHFTLSPIFEAHQRVNRLAVLGLDYTRIIKYQRLIEHKSEELSRSNADLEQFAYAASHDLQEPVRAVIGFLDLLVKRHPDIFNDDALTYVDRARSAAGRMMAIIENLLDYSRVGTRGKAFKDVDLNLVVDEVKGILGRVIRLSQATVERGRLPLIKGDQAQLELLFQNLISNAIKFQPKGRAPKIRIGAERRTTGWRLWVEDNGIGIEERDRDRIFGVLSRLHHQSEYPGTGIGLAVCKRIIERHGGEITAEPAGVGPGTRLVVMLPFKPPGP